MKKWHWILLGIITLASIAAEIFGHHEAHHFWSGIPLWWIWFGSAGCAVLILFAKKFLGHIVYKKEDYYHE